MSEYIIRESGYPGTLSHEVVGELIRCKDCKHWHDAPTSDGYNSCEKDALIRHKDFFCAAAERKEGETG